MRDCDLEGVDWNRIAFEKVDICHDSELQSCGKLEQDGQI